MDVALPFECELVAPLGPATCWSLAALWIWVSASVALRLFSVLSEFLLVTVRIALVDCRLVLFFAKLVSVFCFFLGGWGFRAALAAPEFPFVACP